MKRRSSQNAPNPKRQNSDFGKRRRDGQTSPKKRPSIPGPHPSALRRKVDPETARYFAEIANLFDGGGVDLEERPFVCANALAETKGKEVELATDMIVSRTVQTLLEGCDLEQLCGFLRACGKGFSLIAVDKYGSHVAETAMKALALHLQDDEQRAIIEETLMAISQVIAADAVNVMSSNYGSHVLRSLLCLCKGVPSETLPDFHAAKFSVALAERLRGKSSQMGEDDSHDFQTGFLDILKFLVAELLEHAKDNIITLRADKHSSFVLQTALKLLVGNDVELMHLILIILGCSVENFSQELFFESANISELKDLFKDTASSHLVEVILEVAPENLYSELLEKVFKGSLLELSSDQCGNFVVQALISSARCKGQVDTIWEELGSNISELFEIGKSGVVASLIAACQRFQTNSRECCEILATSVSSESESPSCIVPHLLFLDSYLFCKEKSKWKWPTGERMNVLGCLLLQTIFKIPKKFSEPYINSMASIETDEVVETAKNSGGSRVFEAFLNSDASSKQKIKVISKLQGHFGELALHPSGSFSVEKCFAACNLPLKEAIVSDLLSVKDELCKTKHGPYIMKKLDLDGFALRPKQWKSRQASKETVYRDFQAAFGSISDGQRDNFLAVPSHIVNKNKTNKFKENGDICPTSNSEFLGFGKPEISPSSGCQRRTKRRRDVNGDANGSITALESSKNFIRNPDISFSRHNGERTSSSRDLAALVNKKTLSADDVQLLFKPTTNGRKNNSGENKTPFVRRNK